MCVAIYSILRKFGKEKRRMPAFSVSLCITTFNISVNDWKVEVEECIANYLDGGYMRCLWCVGQILALSVALSSMLLIRDAHPLYLWPLLIVQNAYCFGLVTYFVLQLVATLRQDNSEMCWRVLIPPNCSFFQVEPLINKSSTRSLFPGPGNCRTVVTRIRISVEELRSSKAASEAHLLVFTPQLVSASNSWGNDEGSEHRRSVADSKGTILNESYDVNMSLKINHCLCTWQVILTIATADKLLVSILHPLNGHLTVLIVAFFIGTSLNHLFDYILWHYYWYQEAEYIKRTGSQVIPFWV